MATEEKTTNKKGTTQKTPVNKADSKNTATKKTTSAKTSATKKTSANNAAGTKTTTRRRATPKKTPSVKKQVKNADKKIAEMNLTELFKALKSEHAMTRLAAAKRLHLMVEEDPEKFKAYISKLANALDVFEAQTRWEILDSLCLLVDVDSEACSKAVNDAQRAMFEEANIILTLNAFKFLCTLGASNIPNSKIVWPYIKDAIETFDGDIDYDKFLKLTTIFAGGKISAPVKTELETLISFDAKNSSGAIGYRAKIVLATLKGKKIPKQKPSKKTLAAQAAKEKAAKKDAADKKKEEKKKTAAKKTSSSKKKTSSNGVKANKKTAAKKTSEKKKSATKKSAAAKTNTAKKSATKKSAAAKTSTAKKSATKKTTDKKDTKKN